MSLRGKAILLALSTLVFSVIVMYVVSRVIFQSSMLDLENRQMLQNLGRTQAALDNEIKAMATTVTDYAWWDDTYNFIQDHNSAYIESTLADSIFPNSQLNIVVLFDTNGKTVFARAYDLKQEAVVTVPTSLDNFFSQHPDFLLPPQDERTVHTGIILLPEGPLVIATSQILTSQSAGPSKGALLMGYYLEGSRIQSIADSVRLPVEIRRLDDPQLPIDFREARGKINVQAPDTSKTLSSETIAGYKLLNDILDNPALLLKVEMPRDIYKISRDTLKKLVIASLITGILLSLMTVLHFQRWFIARLSFLSRLGEEVNQIGIKDDLTARVHISGKDEISRVGNAINQMLEMLDRSYRTLRESEARLQQSELSLRQHHTQTQQLLASIYSILIGVDSEGLVTHWNTLAERVFGITAEETIGKPFTECKINWDWELVIEAAEVCMGSNEHTRLDDFQFISSDGNIKILGLTFAPLALREEGKSGFLLAGADISQRKILERQLAQSQKMEAVGHLAAGIAHEVNTPIQYISYNIHFLSKSFNSLTDLLNACKNLLKGSENGKPPKEATAAVLEKTRETNIDYMVEQIPQAIHHSLEGVERVTKIVSGMKDFSYPGGEGLMAVDINRSIESTIEVARNEWKKFAEIKTEFDQQLPPIQCYPSEVNQALLNILVNAVHAIEDSHLEMEGRKGLIRFSTQQNGNWVDIQIQDNGTGIPEKARPHIFDPFFTTKPMGKGTGQGLYITHQIIVEKHHGFIRFETEVGKGTTFFIRIPINPKEGQYHG
jgi:two-component system, NtrC family, sensor kinase